jgi:hypothetical protein
VTSPPLGVLNNLLWGPGTWGPGGTSHASPCLRTDKLACSHLACPSTRKTDVNRRHLASPRDKAPASRGAIPSRLTRGSHLDRPRSRSTAVGPSISVCQCASASASASASVPVVPIGGTWPACQILPVSCLGLFLRNHTKDNIPPHHLCSPPLPSSPPALPVMPVRQRALVPTCLRDTQVRSVWEGFMDKSSPLFPP